MVEENGFLGIINHAKTILHWNHLLFVFFVFFKWGSDNGNSGETFTSGQKSSSELSGLYKTPSALLQWDQDTTLTIPIQDKTQPTLHFHLKDG